MPISMDSIYNPEETKLTAEWFGEIGDATGNEQSWCSFRMGLMQSTAASTIGLLRKARDNDVDTGLMIAKLSIGYKEALCEYLTPKGSQPFSFTSPGGSCAARETSSRGCAPASAMSQKKFGSQKDRPPLGRELGPEMLGKLTLPEHLFQEIKHSKETPMQARGLNSTEKVADLVWQWIFTKYGSIHVDAAFCERMEELLNAKWPLLRPWGLRERSWRVIIANRFTNARLKLGAEHSEKEYKSMKNIAEIDMCSPAKKLLSEGFGVSVEPTKRSLHDALPAAAGGAGEEEAPTVTVAQGVPVLGALSGAHLKPLNDNASALGSAASATTAPAAAEPAAQSAAPAANQRTDSSAGILIV